LQSGEIKVLIVITQLSRAGLQKRSSRAAEYAGYKPKPYVVDEEKLLAQLRARRQAILAEPRISDSDLERFEAIRKEYRERKG